MKSLISMWVLPLFLFALSCTKEEIHKVPDFDKDGIPIRHSHHVNDYAQVLDSIDVLELEHQIEAGDSLAIEIVVVVVPSLHADSTGVAYSIGSLTQKIIRTWKIGAYDHKISGGVLCLISVKDHQMDMQTIGIIDGLLSNTECQYIVNENNKSLVKGISYTHVLKNAIEQVSLAYAGTLYREGEDNDRTRLFWALILLIGIVCIIIESKHVVFGASVAGILSVIVWVIFYGAENSNQISLLVFLAALIVVWFVGALFKADTTLRNS